MIPPHTSSKAADLSNAVLARGTRVHDGAAHPPFPVVSLVESGVCERVTILSELHVKPERKVLLEQGARPRVVIIAWFEEQGGKVWVMGRVGEQGV